MEHAAESGIDIFRIFDSLNYVPNLRVAMEAVQNTHAVCEAAICYTGDILDPTRDKYTLRYYVDLAKELENMGAHVLAIKDMAGLCRPYAAQRLVAALREEIGLPIHFHTHDTSGINAASVLKASEADVDIVDLALAAWSGSTAQPNLNSVVAALQHTERDTGLDLDALNEISDYFENISPYYAPFDTAPRSGTAEVYLHEMPGGQYTNLKEQAAGMGLSSRWPEIARTYAEVNDLFGDIVKVTPSSKVVGDLAMFCITRGIKPVDILNFEPGTTPFPESVIDMLSGGLGQPLGGWPTQLQRVVLGDKEVSDKRPGEDLSPLDLDAEREKLSETLEEQLDRAATDDDLYDALMYPQVQAEFAKFVAQYGDVSVLPTPAYFYGLQLDEEIAVEIEAGKTLIIKLISVGAPDKDGRRSVNFELNGMARGASISDKSLAVQVLRRPKAEAGDNKQIGAPIPGMVTSIACSVGGKVSKGEKLVTLEAMKMYTTINAPGRWRGR